MKRNPCTKIITTIVLTFGAISSFGQMWLSVGAAPSSDGGGTKLHFQAKALVLGDSELALFSIPIFQTIYSITRSPTALIRALGSKRTGSTFGFDALYFFGDSKTVLPYVSVGLYASKRAEVAQSNVTKWYYTQKDQSTILLSGELGLHMVTENGWLLGLDTIPFVAQI
ncbi:MAG: hypothetical protein IPH54_22700 [Rhodoferax sp.]|nr:hypothetical protein [Rhodoferax sp.]